MSFSRIKCFGESEKTTAKSLMSCSLIWSSVPARFASREQFSQAGPAVIGTGLRAGECSDLGVKLLDGVGLGIRAEIAPQPVVQDGEELQGRQVAVDLANEGSLGLGECARRLRIPQPLCLRPRLAGTAGGYGAVRVRIGVDIAAANAASLAGAERRRGDLWRQPASASRRRRAGVVG